MICDMRNSSSKLDEKMSFSKLARESLIEDLHLGGTANIQRRADPKFIFCSFYLFCMDIFSSILSLFFNAQ